MEQDNSDIDYIALQAHLDRMGHGGSGYVSALKQKEKDRLRAELLESLKGKEPDDQKKENP
jgi:hypothetical protein